ncbi:outer membrane efflux protein [delta proteobacterium NaphS2]|nr:outer membrane efflux protein [delta proteobacterium NaphS2]
MKWIISLALVIVFAATLVGTVSPEGTDTRLNNPATVQDLVAYAYQNNPRIRQVREAWREIIEQYRISTGYPDPELRFTYFPEPIETRLGPQDWMASLNQRIPFPGKLSRAGKVVEAEARVAHIKLDRTVKEVMASVRRSFYELLYIRTAIRVAAQNRRLLEHLRKLGETAYAKDRASLMDMVKAQSQLGQIRYDEILLAELEQTEKTRLNGILNRAPDAKIGKLLEAKFQPVVFDLKGLYRLAETNQEDLRMARALVDRADARAELARFENLPDFNVGVSYSSIGQPDIPVQPEDSGRDVFGFQVGVTIPLWFDKNSGRTARAQAGIRKAKAAEEAALTDIHTRVHDLFFRLNNARRLVTLYRDDLLPQAMNAMEIAETWYREGQASFPDFVETQAVYYNFQLALARASADYGKVLASLEQLVGQTITREPAKAKEKTPEEMK